MSTRTLKRSIPTRRTTTSSLVRNYASDASSAPSPLTLPMDTPILPPIPLYRRILRAHRTVLGKQDQRMRTLGDIYVKSEFRLHRDSENPAHVVAFLSQWTHYLHRLTGQNSPATGGEKWEDPSWIEKLSNEQIGQLYELMRAARGMPDENDSKK